MHCRLMDVLHGFEAHSTTEVTQNFLTQQFLINNFKHLNFSTTLPIKMSEQSTVHITYTV